MVVIEGGVSVPETIFHQSEVWRLRLLASVLCPSKNLDQPVPFAESECVASEASHELIIKRQRSPLVVPAGRPGSK